MREIKFRGVAVNDKRWVFGFYIERHEIAEILQRSGTVPIIPKSLGQFTGFKDKNGKEIYEGDIIGDWNEVDGEMVQSRESVYFDERLGEWMIDSSSKNDRTFCYSLFAELENFQYEIIGNIHQNIDLKI